LRWDPKNKQLGSSSVESAILNLESGKRFEIEAVYQG
jgi:hypothetical protein